MKKIFPLFLLAFLSIQGIKAQNVIPVKEDHALRVMTYNIRNAKGMDLKTDYSRIADVVNRVSPDIVAVQEVDSVTKRSGGVDVLTELASLTGMYATYGAAIDYDGGKYGVGILSKEKPVSYKNTSLPGREEARTILVAEFEGCVLACTHWSLTEEDRLASVAIVNELANQHSKPFFMVGDFNMEPESEESKLLAKNWRVLNNLNMNTFPSDEPDRCIDYIFLHLPLGVSVKLLQDSVLRESMASDHRPVFVDVEL